VLHTQVLERYQEIYIFSLTLILLD